jgi:hypothetical protein
VGVLSLALVAALPYLVERLAPLLSGLRQAGWLLHGVRGLVAFVLMLLPATGMGMSLPLLTRALTLGDPRFGVALGRLYGWNTPGGVAGAVAGETLLVARLGLFGTAVVAASLNILAAAGCLYLDRLFPTPAAAVPAGPAGGRPAHPPRLARLLAAASLGGALLLGLEVVWHRLLQLFVFGTQLAFAVMLATVLAGIGLGGLLAAAWLARRPGAARSAAAVALAGGIATVLTYSALDPSRIPTGLAGSEIARTLWLSALLSLPTSIVSGVLFTLLGAAVRDEVAGDVEAAGWLTLANTVGAALGAPLVGLGLLPWLGIEQSLFFLALAYGVAGWALVPWSVGRGRAALAGTAVLFTLVAALFPFGLMPARFVRSVLDRQAADGSRLVAFREGQTETALLLQKDWGGRLSTRSWSRTRTR